MTKKITSIWLVSLALAAFSFLPLSVICQTTWDGSTDTDWNNADNWSAGVPDANDDVTIANVTNDPTISATGAVAQSVTVNSGGVLTIASTGALTINGAATEGIFNSGTVNNNGMLTIGNTSSVGTSGIRTQNSPAIFNNNSGGQITINNSTSRGIFTSNTGTFNNAGTITIGATASVGTHGINNTGTFTNSGGQITIDNTTTGGIYNLGTFTNDAIITIGATTSIGQFGIRQEENDELFTNSSSGEIHIDRSTSYALLNQVGTFTNAGDISIGANASVGGNGIVIASGTTFNNNTGGEIQIDNSTSNGILMAGTFNNQAIITIGANASVGAYGISCSNTFNNSGGQINIDNATTSGIHVSGTSGNFTNQSNVTIGATIPVTNLLTGANTAQFNNNSSGTLKGTGSIAADYFTIASGTLAPGTSPGTMTFTGSEDFSSSTYQCEINGATPGTDYDHISVSGTATISSTTSILSLTFGFAAYNNQTFDILTATAVSGSYGVGNVSFSNIGAGNVTAVNVTYPGGNTVRVTVESPLPVEMFSFTGKKQGEEVLLNWRTASETNNEGFQVQRSGDGKNWNDIAFVPGHGTTLETQSYTYTDERPLPGTNYYRLRQLDFDGNFEYSPTVSVAVKQGGGGIHLFPNPTSGNVTLALETEYSGEATLTIYDLMGRQVKTQALSLEGGPLRTGVDLLGLPGGVYLLEMKARNEQRWERLVVE
ncbi:MAG: T9SS type A sorting domain-containing protein [Bacteroidetes bacterium]|nr:T9SS type A sorting domain-containing protein [Bacteroidota bacterium]